MAQKLNIALKPGLKKTQAMMLSPQMQFGLEILRMSNQQLADYAAAQIADNPFLDFAPSPVDGKNIIHDDQGYNQAQTDTLNDFIIHQIHEDIRDANLRMLAQQLVYYLDDDAYLRVDDHELCTALHITQAELRTVLHALRQLSPAGIFARSMPDRLKIQLERKGKYTPQLDFVLSHLDRLAAGDTAFFAEEAHIDEAELRAILSLIKTLRPTLKDNFDTAPLDNVRSPDILFSKEKTRWHVALNETTLPKILVLDAYWEELGARPMHTHEKAYLKKNWMHANRLKRAIAQRAATLLRIAKAVSMRQHIFLSDGMTALAPMTTRQIGTDIEMHDSTISRAIAGKLIEAPAGLFELRTLFTPALKGRDGRTSNMSAGAVKEKVKRLIAQEGDAFLSDGDVADLLQKEGIDIARRTIAKYRAHLNIPSLAERRKRTRLQAFL